MRRFQVPPSRYKPNDWKGHIWLFFRDVAWGTLTALVYVLSFLYKIFGSWWIEPWFENWNRKHLANELLQAMPFLFQIYGGTIVSSPRGKTEFFAESVAYVKAGTLLFRFSTWRDEALEPLVANAERPSDMYGLNELLALLEPNGRGAAAKGDKNLREYGEILKNQFEQISAALAESQINETRKKLAAERLRQY